MTDVGGGGTGRRWHAPSRCWVDVLAVTGSWAVVRYPDDSRGSVPVGTLAVAEPGSARDGQRYRVGGHWGVTIVREGSGPADGGGRRAGDVLVAVVLNGDVGLAGRICAGLNGLEQAGSAALPLLPWDGGEAAAVERYRDAVARGLSDYEAREEGWPSAGAGEGVSR